MMVEAGEKAGLPFDMGREMKTWMEEAGFVNVKEYRMRWLLGPWAKDQHLSKGECLIARAFFRSLGEYCYSPSQALILHLSHAVGQWNQLRVDTGIADFCSRRFHNQLGVRFGHISCMRNKLIVASSHQTKSRYSVQTYGMRFGIVSFVLTTGRKFTILFTSDEAN